MLAAIVATALACSDDGMSAQQSHNSAKAAWQKAAITSYTFTAQRTCECLPAARGPVRITVTNGAVTAVALVETGAAVEPSLWFDVNALFSLIEDQMSSNPKKLEARYDPTLGYPTYVAYGNREVDAGAIIEISALSKSR